MGNSRLVYSTSSGRVHTTDGSRDSLQKLGAKQPGDGVVRVFRECAGRRGKVVTVIRGIPEQRPALAALVGDLKRLCGAGGSVKDDAIEIQGDHRDRVAGRLREAGYIVKIAGG